MLLAIDTATRGCSLALHDGQEVIAEQTWRTLSNHTVELAPAVRAVLAQHKLTFADVTALGVSIGPGSYTGLRIGVALAKGLASARNLPVVGVTTLDTLAAGQPPFQGALIVAVQAGRGRIVAATYQWRRGRWKPRGEAKLLGWDEMIESIDGAAILTGEIDEAGRAALLAAQESGVPLTLALPAFRLRRASFLAEEAWARLRELNDGYPARAIAPVYVKTKDVPA